MDQLIKLNEMKSGQKGVVDHFSGNDSEQYRLMEMGLLVGTEVRFVRRAPLGGPIEVEIRGFHLSLRVQEAEQIGIKIG